MKVLFFTDIGESVTLNPTWEGGEPTHLGRYAAWDQNGCVDVSTDIETLRDKYGDLKVVYVGDKRDSDGQRNQKGDAGR